MGCSSSRQIEDDARPPTSSSPTSRGLNAPPISTSQTAINPSAAIHPNRPSQFQSNISSPRASVNGSHRTNSHGAVALNAPFNVPLQPPIPWRSTTRTWTSSQLRRERYEFFETRVTGRPEVWSALRNVTDLLREGELETARGILDAAGVTLPTGSLIAGGYDEAGGLYRLPEQVASDPTNMINDDVGSNIDGETVVGSLVDPKAGSVKIGEDEMGEDHKHSDQDLDTKELRRDGKGKGKAVLDKDAVKVRCRLSDRGGPDVVIWLGRRQHVGVLAQRVGDESDIPLTMRVRIIYLGKILDERETLDQQGWKETHVLNAFVVINSGVSELSK